MVHISFFFLGVTLYSCIGNSNNNFRQMITPKGDVVNSLTVSEFPEFKVIIENYSQTLNFAIDTSLFKRIGQVILVYENGNYSIYQKSYEEIMNLKITGFGFYIDSCKCNIDGLSYLFNLNDNIEFENYNSDSKSNSFQYKNCNINIKKEGGYCLIYCDRYSRDKSE